MISIIAGLLYPTEGQVEVFGTDIYRLTDTQFAKLRLNTIGFIFQQFNLLPTLTAAENAARRLGIRRTGAARWSPPHPRRRRRADRRGGSGCGRRPPVDQRGYRTRGGRHPDARPAPGCDRARHRQRRPSVGGHSNPRTRGDRARIQAGARAVAGSAERADPERAGEYDGAAGDVARRASRRAPPVGLAPARAAVDAASRTTRHRRRRRRAPVGGGGPGDRGRGGGAVPTPPDHRRARVVLAWAG